MKFRGMWLPLLAVVLALPAAARAQEDDCPCRARPGMIGVMFDTESGRGEGVRVIQVRPGSAADRAGVREGDVVIRLNGGDPAESVQSLPMRLQSGDTVRLQLRRENGEAREVVVIAEPRPGAQLGFVRPGAQQLTLIRPGRDERVVIIGGDSMNVPLEALTFRIDSLRTQLMDLEGGRFEVRVDSVVRMFGDSAGVWGPGMPNVQFRRREGMPEDVFVEGAFGEGRPFFMELGRRAAAGAELAEMNEGLSTYFGGQREGALVIDVAPETPAARAGLQPGDVIVRAGGEEVSNPEDVRRALNRAEEGRVQLEVVRQGRRRELSLEWTGGDRMFHREVRPARVLERTREPRN